MPGDGPRPHSEELLRKLFRSSPAAIGLVRLDDGVILDVNEAYERLYGWPRAESVGRSVEQLHVWAKPQERARYRALMQAQGRVTGYACTAQRRNGELFDCLLSSESIEADGERVALVIVQDVSEQRRAEQALRESEQRFRALVELSSDWYWVTDAEHRFTFREGEILRRMGIPPDADYGKRRWEMGFRNMTEADWTEHRAALARREEFRDLLLERGSPDGRVHWATVSGRPLFDGEGRFLGYHGTGRDVTLQVLAERHLRQLNEELEHKVAKRTAELGAANRELEAFSYSVSHDLRAPLRAIGGFAALLEEHCAPGLDAEARDYLQRLRAAVRRMGQLIDDLLALATVGRATISLRTVDLSALARQVAAELDASDPSRRVEWRIAGGLAARADPGLIRVALENLLGNAWKYTGRTPHAVIEFSRNGAGEYVVADNGAGFDPAYIQGLFQPFRRLHTEQEFEGNGIGLATVRRILERHGGQVRGEGAPGAGARFTFSLPPG